VRKVFFSFHYERDIWRVAQVRNCNVVTKSYQKNEFLDKAQWETIKRGGDAAIKRWINAQLNGTSVTIVLIGAETYRRPYVNYEIKQSFIRGNGLLGIYIHNVKNQFGLTDRQGLNPFDNFRLGRKNLSAYVETYDWVYDFGRNNIQTWIERAAIRAGR